MFDEGVWDTEESGLGLIKTNENGLNYKDLISKSIIDLEEKIANLKLSIK